MSLFDLFGKRTKKGQEAAEQEADGLDGLDELEMYSGMRVEVTSPDGTMLFVAKLMGVHGAQAELHQYSKAELDQDTEPFRVNIRGYSDRDRKAIHLEGVIYPTPQHIWKVEALSLSQAKNDRAFFRLSTNLDATASMFSGLEIGEKPCKLLNISVGGACVSSESRYHEGDKFLLKVRLMEDRPESLLFCQVLRVIQRDETKAEYGCRFLELTEEAQDRIAQHIFDAQRQKRASASAGGHTARTK